MSGDARKLQPIIVKKVRKAAHAPHGGAWKIAYADFVTAMMAFFLLMWLLGSTTEGDKKGLADFFQAPLKVALGGGSGSGDASHVVKGGGQDITRTHGQVRRGDIEARSRTFNLQALRAEQQRGEQRQLQALAERMQRDIANSPRLAVLAGQVRLEMTRDGLRIQIVDEADRVMFDGGSAVVKPHLRELLDAIAQVLRDVPFALTMEGHTDAKAFAAGGASYGNWELSSDRANAARREMVAAGLAEGRVLRVLGLASSIPLVPETPEDPRNRRISIIVMNHEAERRLRDPGDGDAEADAEPAGAPAVPTAAVPPVPQH